MVFSKDMNRIRASVLIKNDDKILLIHRIKNESEYYILPGGGVEKGEAAVDAAVREAKEETNLDVEIDEELWRFHNAHDNRDHCFFLVTHFSGVLELVGAEKDRASDTNRYSLEWLDLKKLKDVRFFPEEIKLKILKTFLNNS